MFLLCIVMEEKAIVAGWGEVFVNFALPMIIEMSDMVCTACGRV